MLHELCRRLDYAEWSQRCTLWRLGYCWVSCVFHVHFVHLQRHCMWLPSINIYVLFSFEQAVDLTYCWMLRILWLADSVLPTTAVVLSVEARTMAIRTSTTSAGPYCVHFALWLRTTGKTYTSWLALLLFTAYRRSNIFNRNIQHWFHIGLFSAARLFLKQATLWGWVDSNPILLDNTQFTLVRVRLAKRSNGQS